VRPRLDETHDPAVRSWVETANSAGTDFPIQNLPLGVFRRRGGIEGARIGVAIGDAVLDLRAALSAGALQGLDAPLREALCEPLLNRVLGFGRPGALAVRHACHAVLRHDAPTPRVPAGCLVPMGDAELLLPASIGDYSDFYASIHHATNVGTMFRPDQPLMPNYKWVPIGYHGRASSIVPSGTGIRRPRGQLKDDTAPAPVTEPTRALDYECEVGAWVGKGNALGVPVPIAEAEEYLFGLSLVNDWSARDIQRWEYLPLGPFLSKSFGTTVSPWIVTLEALEPFRAPASLRPEGDPPPLAYLDDSWDRAHGGVALDLSVWIASTRMRAANHPPVRLSECGFAGMYWTMAQLLAHHASNGCNLRPGDLLASGTVSGPTRETRGCLLELTWRGTEPLTLPGGETRRFLVDGDEVVIRGKCERAGFVSIGFGECRGTILPAA
jgi:fumarylacetoacetase